MNTRMDSSRLHIGVYSLAPYARSEAHIRDLAACGINLAVCVPDDRPMLDLMAKYGVGAIVTGAVPGWVGGNTETAGQMAQLNPLSRYEEAAASFIDHPAIWGIDIGDEPSALDFPHYARVFELVNRCFPRQFPYLNLLPNYGLNACYSPAEALRQMGTKNYTEHIERYCQNISADYLCYDYYMYTTSVAGAYENLRVASDACLRSGRRMWIVLQVNSSRKDEWISENQLQFQAYSALAFGAEVITWACYTAGWFHNHVLDENGEKTEQYEKLKTVNAELRTLGDAYMKYRRVATHFVGFQNAADLQDVGQPPVAAASTGVFTDVRAENGENLLVGQMVSRTGDGSCALLLCGANDPWDKNPAVYEVLFRADGRRVSALSGTGEVPLTRRADGSYSLPLRSCQGVLVIAE